MTPPRAQVRSHPDVTAADGELMEALVRGQTQALGELYMRYAAMVKTALSRFAPELPEAERNDLTQDVFIALLEGSDRYSESQQFRAYLYGIAVNKARDWRRRHWLRARLLRLRGAELEPQPRETAPAESFDARRRIARALSQLPEAQREVLLLHADGFSGDEIARMLGVEPNTVWTRLHRARKTLLEARDEGEGT